MTTTYNIGKKLYISLSAILTLSLLLAGLGYYISQDARTQSELASRAGGRKIELAGTINREQSEMWSAQRGLLLATLQARPDRAVIARNEFQQAAAGIEKALAEFGPLLETEEGRRMLAVVREGYQRWRPLYTELDHACGANKAADASALADRIMPIYEALAKGGENLATFNARLLKSHQDAVGISAERAQWATIFLCLLLVLGSIATVITIRRITRDLDRIVTSMGENADQVASASSLISSSSQTLAQAASEQAASLEETSASAEQITSMTRKNADNSQAAVALMAQVDRHIGAGNHTLGEMVTSMQSINDSSEKVSRIIKVIDEIAFQTNILALNAAVEAARAGEAGMGFAVVADEVRNLAQRSAKAAKDTAELIEESISRSKEGNINLEKVAGVIRSITDSATQVKTLIDEVHVGSEEQARGIEQIARAVAQMDKVTQQNAANAEESASSSEELSAQAASMRDVISKLEAMVGAGEGAVNVSVKTKPEVARINRQLPTTHARQATAQSLKSHKPPTRTPAPAQPVNREPIEFSLDEFKDF